MNRALSLVCLPVALALASLSRFPHATSAPITLPPITGAKGSPPKLALYEPSHGCYLGVALDYSQVKQPTRAAFAPMMRAWNTKSGRDHAIFTQFIAFPTAEGTFPQWSSEPGEFCAATASVNGTPLLTLEPMGQPLQFADGWRAGTPAYQATEAFAKAAGAWGKPLFIRWAHEMNGSWYPWAEWVDKNRNQQRDAGEDTGFTAAKYVTAWRNVAALFRRYAPNVALVWCPNSGLLGGGKRDVFRPWYPGSDMVDWVGLDVYERGWTMPAPGAHLWGGMLRLDLTHDMTDDTKTQANESVNFYQTFAERGGKPMMLCETGATNSYRFDLPLAERAKLSHEWRTGHWNAAEYGWLEAVYGTSHYALSTGNALLAPLDRDFPRIKAVTWFQIAKRETMPAERSPGQIMWFDNAWCDYQIGGSAEEDAPSPYASAEWKLYQTLTSDSYFLSRVGQR